MGALLVMGLGSWLFFNGSPVAGGLIFFFGIAAINDLMNG